MGVKLNLLLLCGAVLAPAALADPDSGYAMNNIQLGQPDGAPPGYEEYISPLVLPAKNATGDGDWGPAVKKARDFVAQLTLEELVNITTGAGIEGRCVGNTGEVTRLGFPGLCLEDSPLGVRFVDNASAFPAGINAATTWSKDLLWQRGAAMGAEHRGKGVNVALGPMMNLGRVAAGGRNWEGFGADPYLTGAASAQTIQGMQSTGVIACAKHFVGNEQEHFRGGSGSTAESSNINDRTMHELYQWPFAESVRAGVGSVMCSYNRINQTYACENSKVLNGLLKEELDFQGFVLSDWAALESGVNSALAGSDMDMPGFIAYGYENQANPSVSNDSYWGAALVEAVSNGSVPLSRVEDMVVRTMAAYYKMGQDSGYPAVNFDAITNETYVDGQLVNEHVNVQSDHYKLIREIGAASTVLLKNSNNSLPLDATKLKQLGVFGSDARASPNGPNGCSDRGCDDGTLAMGWGSGTANFPYLVDPYSAIQSYLQGQAPNVSLISVLSDYSSNVTAVAQQAETCLVFTNSDSGEGYITVEENAGDRNALTLWHDGDSLISSVAAECSNTIVILHTVGPLIVEPWIDHPNVTAVLNAGLPGQESGNAIVDVLFGKVNPSGKLPYTMAKKREDYPADVQYTSDLSVPQINYSEELLIDYRWFDAKNIEPRYEFGFGLSYTSFGYSSLSVKACSGKKRSSQWNNWPSEHTATQGTPGGDAKLWDEVYTITFNVKNKGSVAGNEVAQMYLGFPDGAGEPPKVLRGFERKYLECGASGQISMTLTKKDISIWNVITQQWEVPSGKFTVFVGASSRDIRLTGSFQQ